MSNCPKCGSSFKAGDQLCSNCGFVFPFSTDILADGTVLQDRYQISKLLHSGGMGYVYLASDNRLQRQCVTKQVKQPVKSAAHRQKLEEEALQMAKLSHPNVAMVFDHFVENNFYFLVVEYIPGKTLSEIFEERQDRISEAEVINWVSPICDIVSYMHKKGIIHRDISPDNIMLTDTGFIKLVDFGTLHQLSELVSKKAGKEGKFGFTPPEQWQGKPVPQSDIFAIGATIYYLLTGFLPLSEEYKNFGSPQPSDYCPDYPPVKAKNPDVSDRLQSMLNKALQIEAGARYSSAEELKRALESGVYETTAPGQQAYSRLSDGTKPLLVVNKAEVDFGVVMPGVSGSHLAKNLVVRNVGGSILMGSITTTEPWILASNSIIESTEFEQNILITIDASRLPLNFSGSGYVNVQTNGGNAQVEIKVTTQLSKAKGAVKTQRKSRKGLIAALVIIGIIVIPLVLVNTAFKSPPPPLLSVNTTPIYFNDLEPGRYFYGHDPKTFTVTNTGGQVLTGEISCDKAWMEVTPDKLEVKPKGEPLTISVRVRTLDMKYKAKEAASIIVRTNGGDKEIPVTISTTDVIFKDDLSNANTGWYVGKTDNSEVKYYNGNYNITVKKEGWIGWAANNKIGQLDDFVIEVDVEFRPISASSSNYAGILFRMKDNDNQYAFLICSGYGQYVLGKIFKGESTNLKNWTEAVSIKKNTLKNRLKISCEGPKITVYANDILLTTVTDYSLSKGDIALAVGKSKSTYSLQTQPDADVLFSNLKISVP